MCKAKIGKLLLGVLLGILLLSNTHFFVSANNSTPKKETSKTQDKGNQKKEIKDKKENETEKKDEEKQGDGKGKKKKCKEIEIQKKCNVEDEHCSEDRVEVKKEKVCDEDIVDLPPEVQAIYKQIASKYGKGSSGEVIYNGKKYDNSTLIYGAVAMKDLKDSIVGLDNQIKIEYELSKLSALSIGGIDLDGIQGYTPNVRSAKTYLTSTMYHKTIKILEALYKLSGQTETAQKIVDAGNKRMEGMKILLDYGAAYAIVLQENAGAFGGENGADKETLKAFAGNGGVFQITDICTKGYTMSLEDSKGYYLNGKGIGGMTQFYAISPAKLASAKASHAKRGGAVGLRDINCENYEGNKYIETPELLIKLGKTHQQLDPKRANHLKETVFLGSANESAWLNYLGRELQYMFQFFNFSAFMQGKLGNRNGLGLTSLSRGSWAGNGYGFAQKILEQTRPGNGYTAEDWDKDVKTWLMYVKNGYKGGVKFILEEKMGRGFPYASPGIQFNQTSNWAEFIMFAFNGGIGANYNGRAYGSIMNNPYVNKIPPRAIENRLGLPGCGMFIKQVQYDGKGAVQQKNFNQKAGMVVQVKSFLAERYGVPVQYVQGSNDGYLKLQKWAYKLYKPKNAALSCFINGSIAI